MYKDKWFSIFMCVAALTMGSCTAFNHHSTTQLRIAQIECQQVTNESND